MTFEAVGLSKRYGSTLALDDVSLTLRPGEVHCLVGENGAGKSTLVKIITGLVEPDAGELSLDGTPLMLHGVESARAAGIAAVYQHPVVFPHLTVTENVFAGRHLTRRRWPVLVDRPAMRSAVRTVFGRLGVDLDPDASMQGLSVGNRQLVEIAKALVSELRVLVLDEPTASLSDVEAAGLYGIVRTLADEGVAILLITHRLEEAFAVGQAISVLRDGRTVGTSATGATSREAVIRQMVGRSLAARAPRRSHASDEVVLEIADWSQAGAFDGVNLSVARGEVLGLAGLVGAGRTEVAQTLIGAARADRGTLRMGGMQVTPRNPGQMLRHGVAYVSEDRHGSGLTLRWPVYMNVSLPLLRELSRPMRVLDVAAERALARQYIGSLDIRPADPDRAVAELSGGNQQKVLLARWIAARPQVLILDEPTAGVDVGAKLDVHNAIDELASQGIAVVLISSDLPELLSLSDRIVVFCEGRVTASFRSDEFDAERIMHAATEQTARVPSIGPAGG